MITLDALTKRYGGKTAVDALTVTIEPGKVTGFLGPNGAGKSTTIRMILGLDTPTSGTALIGGRRYTDLRHPVRRVGALLEARAVHPGRSARAHLRAMARTHGIGDKRVEEMLALVGLTEAAGKRAGAYSLGMGQRLGIAGALLGDPEILILDEPVNGLDPDGVRWVRELMRALAAEGRTVFVSSHLMSEMQQTADHLVIIGRGRLLADAPIDTLIAGSARRVKVGSPETGRLDALAARLSAAGVTVRREGDGTLITEGVTAATIGDLAFNLGLRLHELWPMDASLEEAYLGLTEDSLEYGRRAHAGHDAKAEGGR
ncbi:ABC transporter ATP-binding protein [Bailinhaonella thermotolerans]|uniref:ABC transporter ATP-binding protein n=1 Tax=Bailinhaonella thermotolerans TaxID=1070861 RepID=A0A3A4AXC2_9ACTN|nr:ABC transporter ATP-binding protein [Bailinhaonella thermotolerans]RJL35302.1 ABC transporter ATP-binding protein [Bailinhaonella thermotolerans]